MFRRSRQGPAAAAKVGRNSIVRNCPDDRQGDWACVAIGQHPLVQSLDVRHELLSLAVRANSETALPEFQQNALLCFRYGAATRELTNDFVKRFLVIRPELLAQSKRFDLKIAKLNSGGRCQRSNRTATCITVAVPFVFHSKSKVNRSIESATRKSPQLEENQESRR